MPKLKTNQAAAKRFKITATGKIKQTRTNKGHFLGKKSPRCKRNLRKLALVDKTNLKRVRSLLPYA